MNELEDMVAEMEAPLVEALTNTLRHEIAYKMANGEDCTEKLDAYIHITGGTKYEPIKQTEQYQTK